MKEKLIDLPPLVTGRDISIQSGGKILAADPRLPLLCDGVSAAIRNYCGWHIAPRVCETFTLDGTGSALLALPTLLPGEVEALEINGEPCTDFQVSNAGLIRLTKGVFPYGYGNIEIRLSHGFTQTPGDIAQVCVQVITNAASSPMGATREQAGQMSVAWSQTAPGVAGGISLLERDLAVLNTYRIGGAL